jgi:hypothetical protein
VYEPRRNFKKRSFKVLICSDPNFPGEKVVEWYECRWTAIEIVFRELKLHRRCRLDPPAAVERDPLRVAGKWREQQRYGATGGRLRQRARLWGPRNATGGG